MFGNDRFNSLRRHPGYNDIKTALSIGGSVVSGLLGSDSNDKAAKQSAKATAAANAMLQGQVNANNAAYYPYTQTGAGANQRLSYLMGIGPTKDAYTLDDFRDYNARMAPAGYSKEAQEADARIQYNRYLSGKGLGVELDPLHFGFRGLNDYNGQTYGSLLAPFSQKDLLNDVVYNTGLEFGQNEGERAINNLASSRGGLDNGGTLKALVRYANDYGTTKAAGAWDRFNTNKNNIYNMLSGQQNMGLNANSSLASNNGALLTGQANNLMGNGQNQANAAIGSGMAWNNAIQGGIGNYLYGQRSQPANASIYGSGSNNGGYGISLNDYSNAIPWYALSPVNLSDI